jgi:hypothetical protein
LLKDGAEMNTPLSTFASVVALALAACDQPLHFGPADAQPSIDGGDSAPSPCAPGVASARCECGFKPRSPGDQTTLPSETIETIGSERFAISTDDVTGLQRAYVLDPVAGTGTGGHGGGPVLRSFDEAEAFCASLRLSNHADWRLPTVAEAVNSGGSLTSQLVAGRPDLVWTKGNGVVQADVAGPFLPECVRQKAIDPVRCYRPGARFTVLSDGLASDAATGLTWTQMASADCAGVSGGAFRKPSLEELITLVDYAIPEPGPTIDPVAFPTARSDLWLATPPVGAWVLSLSSGRVSHFDVGFGGATFCVR